MLAARVAVRVVRQAREPEKRNPAQRPGVGSAGHWMTSDSKKWIN